MYNDIRAVFSESRLATYLKAANQDEQKALELYKLNLMLSESIYPTLCILEITLRNRISGVLVKHYGDNWFEGDKGKWFDGQFLALPTRKYNRELDAIQKTSSELLKKKRLVTKDTLTANLTFAFWTGMTSGCYERSIWQRYISQIFPNAPKNYNLIRNLYSIRDNLHGIRELRNRTFHHEPIFCTKKMSFSDLIANYDHAKKLTGWLSQDALIFLNKHDQFSSLVVSIPSNMK
ncbi:MAG: Abi family protein [Nostoc sp.]|uniref:Abi family protein n=1 Tax=Nostoc sp. TaxID=1180 RepID=UPI002FF549C6